MDKYRKFLLFFLIISLIQFFYRGLDYSIFLYLNIVLKNKFLVGIVVALEYLGFIFDYPFSLLSKKIGVRKTLFLSTLHIFFGSVLFFFTDFLSLAILAMLFGVLYDFIDILSFEEVFFFSRKKSSKGFFTYEFFSTFANFLGLLVFAYSLIFVGFNTIAVIGLLFFSFINFLLYFFYKDEKTIKIKHKDRREVLKIVKTYWEKLLLFLLLFVFFYFLEEAFTDYVMVDSFEKDIFKEGTIFKNSFFIALSNFLARVFATIFVFYFLSKIDADFSLKIVSFLIFLLVFSFFVENPVVYFFSSFLINFLFVLLDALLLFLYNYKIIQRYKLFEEELSGILLMAYNFGGILSYIFGGFIYEYFGFNNFLLFSGVLAFVLVVLSFLIKKEEKK